MISAVLTVVVVTVMTLTVVIRKVVTLASSPKCAQQAIAASDFISAPVGTLPTNGSSIVPLKPFKPFA